MTGQPAGRGWTDRNVVELIETHPLAFVISGEGFVTTPLPMLVETDASGRPAALLGHFARRNPQVDVLRADPRACFLFVGPHGYVSPELVTTTKDWAPTWNYAFARIVADVVFDDDLSGEAIQRLVHKMERGRQEPWTTAEMGARYERLKAQVIGFRATIVEVDARFKLAQDERPEVLEDIVAGFGGSALASWMQRFNADRLGS